MPTAHEPRGACDERLLAILEDAPIEVGAQLEADPTRNMRLVRRGRVLARDGALAVVLKGARINERAIAAGFTFLEADEWFFDPTFRGRHHEKEVLYWRLAAALGIECPPCVLRAVEGERVVVRPWIEGADLAARYPGIEKRPAELREHVASAQAALVDVLDYLVFNSDRKLSNLVLAEGRLVPIDHEFILEPASLPRYAWQMLADPLTSLYCSTYRSDPALRSLVDAAVGRVREALPGLERIVARFCDEQRAGVHLGEFLERAELLRRHEFPTANARWYDRAFELLRRAGNSPRTFTRRPEGV